MIASHTFMRPAPLLHAYEPIALSLDESENQPPVTVARIVVSPGFVRTLGLELMDGRGFEQADVLARQTSDLPTALILSKSVADRLWPNGSPVGLQLNATDQGRSYSVVGVVADHRIHSPYGESFVVYEVWNRRFHGAVNLVARTSLPGPEALARLRELVSGLDSALVTFDSVVLTERIRDQLADERLLAQATPVLAVVAIILVTLAIWGLVAGLVQMRRHEIAVRMAVGASRWSIQARYLRQVLSRSLIGASLGLILFLSLGSSVPLRLYRISIHDPWVVAVSLVVPLLSVVLAAYLPLSRVGGRNIADILKTE